jgi:hypothetical protein
MDLEQALAQVPSWERRLYELTGSDPETFDDAIARFDEFDDEERSTRADLDLVVLLGEAGLLERAVAAASGAASVRVWQVMSRGRARGTGDRRRRSFVLPILRR